MSSSSLLWCLLVTCVLAVVQIYGEERTVLKVFNLRATKLNSGMFQTPDAYVKVFMGSAYGGKTVVRNDNTDPWWDEDFAFFNARVNNALKLEVYDSDMVFDDLLGTCERAIKNGTFQHSCNLKEGGTLHYSYTLGPIQKNLEDFESLE